MLDNTYCAGILSAEGHQWSTTAFSTDYMKKSYAGFPRSYPDGMDEDDRDALAYSPAGFIWDNALVYGKTIRNYGEFTMPTVRWRDANRKGSPRFLDCYKVWRGEADDVIFESEPAIEMIRPFSLTDYVGWHMDAPDQYRADFIINELKEHPPRPDEPRPERAPRRDPQTRRPRLLGNQLPRSRTCPRGPPQPHPLASRQRNGHSLPGMGRHHG